MGKRTTRFLCGFCTFILLLYSVEVFALPAPETIMDVMKNDKLCEEMPLSLLESNITKDCANLKYPQGDLTIDYPNMNSFICLGVYDTMYKICQYFTQGQKPFYNSTTLFTDIQKYFPNKTENQTKFCEHVKGITPMYQKIEPFVIKLTESLDNSESCPKVCFSFNNEFKPLCAILAWINNIDIQFKTSKTLQNTGKVAMKDSMPTNERTQQEKSQGNEESEKKITTKDINMHNTEKSEAGSLNAKTENIADKKNTVLEKESNLDKSTKNIEKTESQHVNGREEVLKPNTANKHLKQQVSTDNDHPLVVSLQKYANNPPVGVDNTHNAKEDETSALVRHSVHKSEKEEHSKALPDEVEQTENGNIPGGKVKEKTASEEAAKPSNEEIPESERGGVQQTENEINLISSTISQHTEQHGDNQDDYNHLDDSGHYGLADTDSMDTGDQNPNIPEPSEQRDIIPRYHNIRPDEESHFFTYFTVIFLVCVAAYIGYHNKQKILAIVLEGRRSRNNRNRRRPSTASYRKLDCTLEEAVTSQCNANVTHVIY